MQVSCKIALSIAVLSAVAAAGDRDAAKSLEMAARSAIHRVESAGGGFRAANPEQRIAVRFRNGGVEFTHRSGRLSLTLVGESPVSRAAASHNRVEFIRGALTEWFVNDVSGIEQGFTISAKRATGPLELQLQVAGDFAPALDHGNVALLRDGKTQLLYAGLHSWDADGRSLPSHALVEGSRIRLLVDDAAARYPVTVDPVVMEAVLTASDGVANDRFASTVAISGDTAVVGAPNDGSRTGQVYVMTRSGSSWSQQTKLSAADGVAGDAFGNSVAIDGDTAVVGSPFGNGAAGAVYVFMRSAGQWNLQAELTAFDGQVRDAFGWSVAISGDTILVGAPQPAFNVGAAYVYTRSGGAWTFQAKLLGPNNSPVVTGDFGYSLSLDGDTAAIGAPGPESNLTGRVFVFQRSGTLWSSQATMLANDAGPNAAILNFGAAVAVNGDTMIAGAPWCLGFYAPGTVGTRTCSTPLPGAAYVFTRSGVTWSQQAKLISSESVNQDRLGFAIGLAGDTAVIGAPGMNSKAGSSYIFSRTSGVWTQAATLLPGALPVAGDQYGSSAAFSADTMLVGAPGYTGKGGADVFRLSNVSLSSHPTSQTFTLSGTGCGTQGTFTAPYSGFWTNCSVQWNSPNLTAPGTRYTFQGWSDSGSQNPRAMVLSSNPMLPTTTFTGNFLTEYLLTTLAVPVSGGSVSGANWYTAGTNALVSAAPNAGFVFTGFTGALGGSSPSQMLLMNAPQTVTGNFTNTPPAVLSGIISAKSGAAANRLWTISLTNAGPGAAYNAQLFVLAFTQTFGTACTATPIRLAPATLPVSLGNLAPQANVQTQVTLDFSGCPANARFTVNVGYMSNGGASGGLISLVNQVQ